MNNNRDKFEAWAKAHEIDITINPAPSYDARLYNDDETEAMYCGWQAATEQSQKEIAELQAREKVLVDLLGECVDTVRNEYNEMLELYKRAIKRHRASPSQCER